MMKSEASLDRNIPPRIQAPRPWEVQKPLCLAMPNGIPVFSFPADEGEVVRADLIFEGGRWHQEQPLQALFANRMLREGTARFSSDEIARRLDYYGAWLELSCAARHTCITLYSLARYLPHTLDLLESLVKEPSFPCKELNVVLQANLRQFLINASKADFRANRTLMNALYGEAHPAGYQVCEDDYRRITPDVLRAFYRRYYQSGGCSIYLAGRVGEDTLRLVEEHFGREPFGGVGSGHAPVPEFRPVASGQKDIFVERKGAAQSAVRMGCLSVNQHHPDYLKLRVLITLFGGYFGSRLMSNIREDKGFTYGISAGLLPYPDEGVLTIATDTAAPNVRPLVQEVYAEMDRLRTELVSDAELTRVRHYMLGETCRNYESVFSLSDAWIFLRLSDLQDSYFSDIFRAINTVTPDELLALARKYLCKENLKVVVCGEKYS